MGQGTVSFGSDCFLVTNNYSFDEIQTKITPFLRAVGFNPKTDLTFIPVSAQMGQNMKDRVDKKVAPWSEGPSLLEYLDSLQIMDRNINAPFMLPVAEKYNELGTMAMGKIESGRVKKGDTLLLMPNKHTVEVAAIYTETAEELDAAFCGDNIRLRLRGINDDEIQPGFVLTSPSKPVKAVTQFKADLSIIETKNIICSGYTCVLHLHTLAEEVTLKVSWTESDSGKMSLTLRHSSTTTTRRPRGSPRSLLSSPRSACSSRSSSRPRSPSALSDLMIIRCWAGSACAIREQ